MGGGDDADVDLAASLGAEGPDFTLLQHAQELGLHGEAHLADLVEEERPLMGDREEPGARAISAGEGAARVPE